MKRLSNAKVIRRDWQALKDFYNGTSYGLETEKHEAKRRVINRLKMLTYKGIPIVIGFSEIGKEIEQLEKNHEGHNLFSSETLQYLKPDLKSFISIQGGDNRSYKGLKHIIRSATDSFLMQKKQFIKALDNAPSINGGSGEQLPEFVFISNYGAGILGRTSISTAFNF